MVDFANLPQVNALYQQAQQTTQAIDNLDSGGLVVSVTIGPPPEDETGPGPMSATVWLSAGAPSLIAEVREALIEREAKLLSELQALGVTPPARSA